MVEVVEGLLELELPRLVLALFELIFSILFSSNQTLTIKSLVLARKRR